MPAYKVSFFKDTIDSILSQTYGDFRLIISDDCSPYDLKAIVDGYHDDRIVYRRNAHNIGAERLAEHWNLLLSLADSEYVILAPDDDLYAPTFLEEIEKLTRRYPQMGIFKSRAQIVDAEGKAYIQDHAFGGRISMAFNIYNQICEQYFMGIGNYVFSTRQLRDMGGFVHYPMAWGSDTITNILMSRNGMGVTKDILFSFRQSGENISSRKDSKKDAATKVRNNLEVRKRILAITETIVPEDDDDKRYIEAISRHIRDSYYGLYIDSAPSFTLKELLMLIVTQPETFCTIRRRMAMIKSWIINR